MVERGEHKTGRIRGKIEQLVANFQQPIIVFEVEPSRPSYTRLSIISIYIYDALIYETKEGMYENDADEK